MIQEIEILDDILEHMVQGVVMFDNSRRLVAWNNQYKKILQFPDGFLKVGLPNREIALLIARRGDLGAGDPEILVADRLDILWEGDLQHTETIAGGENTYVVSFKKTNSDGRVLFYTDITDQKRENFLRQKAEDALKRAGDMADGANQTKSDFLTSMSRELRTPMNAILGFGQMLEFNRNEPLTVAQKGCVDHILKSGQYLLDLINDVFDLTRIEAGKVSLSIEEIAPKVILDECIFLMTKMAEEQGIHMFVSDAVTEGTKVHADHTRFKQVLLNLMSNAVKYNRKNGTVSINFNEADDNMLRIAMTDTGDGISEDKQVDLFKPFSRLGAENSAIEGAGIGLAVCKNLMALMNGNVGVISEVGQGSTFWIELPMVKSGHDKAPTTVNVTLEQGEKSLQDITGIVLCIDDEPANLDLLEMIFTRLPNIKLLMAKNGEQGLDLVRNCRPSLILTDINLPGMSGSQLLEELQKSEKTRDIPVLAISGNFSRQDIESGMSTGFKDYISKPFRVSELIDAVTRNISA